MSQHNTRERLRQTPTDHERRAMDRLKGEYKHFCPEWDFMAIDEFCPEFDACLCFDEEDSNNAESETE